MRFRFAAQDVTDATVGTDGTVRASFPVPEFYGRFSGRQVYEVWAEQENSATGDSALFTLTV